MGRKGRKRRSPKRGVSFDSEGAEEAERHWASADMELMDQGSTAKHKNKFFAREIEVSAEEFEECRQLYVQAAKHGAGGLVGLGIMDVDNSLKGGSMGRSSAERQEAEQIVSRQGSTSMSVAGRTQLQERRNTGLSLCSEISEGSTPTSHVPQLARASTIMLSMPSRENQRMLFRSCMGLPIISPFHKAYLIWRWIILFLDATYAAFIVPIHAAMQPDTTYFGMTWMEGIAIVSTILYSADILIQFNVAWIAYSQDLKQILVLDGRKIVKFYIKKGFFIDFVTIVPMLAEIVIQIGATIGDGMPSWVVAVSPWIRALRLLRFVRMFRICRLDFLTRLTGRMDIFSPAVSSLIMLLYFISFMVNLLGCIWYIIGWYGGIQDSWLTTKSVLIQIGTLPGGEPELEEIPLTDASFGIQFIASLYWATTTVTTVGYGDIIPANAFEMAVAIVVEFMGVLVFGLLIGILSSVFMSNSKAARQSQALQDRIQEANDWMVARRLPHDIRGKVRAFYSDVWQRQMMTHDDAKMLVDLPYSLRSQVTMSIVKHSLRSSPQNLLRCLPAAILQLVVATMVPITVCSGQDLVKEGSPARRIWLLQTGEVAELHHYRVAALHVAPQFLGLMNLAEVLIDRDDVVERPSHCGFRSIGLSMAWEIELSELSRLLRAFPGIRGRVVSSVLGYLESCILNPSPVEQYNETVARVSVRLQVTSEEESGEVISRKSLDLSQLRLSKGNLQLLRMRDMQIDGAQRKKKLLMRRRSHFPSNLPEDMTGLSKWERLRTHVYSGAVVRRGGDAASEFSSPPLDPFDEAVDKD